MPYQFIPDDYSSAEWEEVFDNPDAEHYCFSLSCYICSYGFTIDVCDSTFTSLRDNSKSGMCIADELENLHLFMKKAWWSIFHIILCNQKSNTCRISGVTPYTCNTGPLIDPLHERESLIYRPMTKTQEKRIVAPKFRDPSKEPRAHWEWVGYPVYYRCWELLLHHELGAIAERDLATVLVALRQRCKETRCQSHAVVPKMGLEDPVRTKIVSDAIGLAL